MKIADALLLRKHLAEKVESLRPLKNGVDKGLFEVRIRRVKISEDIDEATMDIPRIKAEDITKEFDRHATELRKLDASIQKANWEHDIDFSPSLEETK